MWRSITPTSSTTMSAIRSDARPSHNGGTLCGRSSVAESVDDLGDSRRIEAEHDIRPETGRHRPLGGRSQREARHTEECRLLLDAAGVGENGRRIGLQREELEIADGREKADVGVPLERGDALPRPRMHREDDRNALGDCLELLEHLGKKRSVHEGRAMQGDEHEPSFAAARAARRIRSARNIGSRRQRVSIIVFPTRWMRSDSIPSLRRFSTASSEWANRWSANSSATIRFTSSGIERSKLRRPDSTCP